MNGKLNGTAKYKTLDGKLLATLEYKKGAYTGNGWRYSQKHPTYLERDNLYIRDLIEGASNEKILETLSKTEKLGGCKVSFSYSSDSKKRDNGYSVVNPYGFLLHDFYAISSPANKRGDKLIEDFRAQFASGKFNSCFSMIAGKPSEDIEVRAAQKQVKPTPSPTLNSIQTDPATPASMAK